MAGEGSDDRADQEQEAGPAAGSSDAPCVVLPDFTDKRSPRVVELLLLGWTDGEIAADLRCSLKTVYSIRRRDELDELAQAIRVDAAQRNIDGLHALFRRWVRTTYELLEDDNVAVRMQASEMLAPIMSGCIPGGDPDKRPANKRRGPDDSAVATVLRRAIGAGSRSDD